MLGRWSRKISNVMGVQRGGDVRELAIGQRPRKIDAADLGADHRVERGDGDRFPVRGRLRFGSDLPSLEMDYRRKNHAHQGWLSSPARPRL